MADLTVTVDRVLIFITKCRLEGLTSLLLLSGSDPSSLDAAGSEPQEVVGLEVVYLLEEDVEAGCIVSKCVA